MKTRYSRSTILGVLAFLAASGGYGGYTVVQNYQKYGSDFETRSHSVVRVVDGDTIEMKIR